MLVGLTLSFSTHALATVFFDSCRFGFIFDGFFFEFADWIAFQVGIGRYIVVFGSLRTSAADTA